jgi:hypothetical protein
VLGAEDEPEDEPVDVEDVVVLLDDDDFDDSASFFAADL